MVKPLFLLLPLLLVLLTPQVFPFVTADKLRIDGSSVGICQSSATSCTVNLTTTEGNDVIILQSVETSGVDSIVANGLTFVMRASTSGGNFGFVNEEWYAIAKNPLSLVTVTLHYRDPTINDGSAIAFSVAGADSNAPFDPSTQLPMIGSGIHEINPEMTVTLSKHSRDLAFMLLSENSFGGQPGSCCNLIQSQFGALAEYRIGQGTIAHLSVISQDPHGWSAIVDTVRLVD